MKDCKVEYKDFSVAKIQHTKKPNLQEEGARMLHKEIKDGDGTWY